MFNLLARTMWIVLMLGSSIALQGCALPYDIMQEENRRACDKLTDWGDRSQCLSQNKKNFDQYEKQRQDVINKKADK
ncbi:hypothetical protein [Undibacterium sp. Ren11W]|uniref:hypothetical protein n=1 Tax=Undibacterium sp. Ren11W TaxID=3413045 RepID=UPI003BF24335